MIERTVISIQELNDWLNNIDNGVKQLFVHEYDAQGRLHTYFNTD